MKSSAILIHLSAGAAIISAISGCATPSSVIQTSDFASRRQTIKTVAVAMPDVQIVRKMLGGTGQQLTEDDSRVAARLSGLVSSQFSSRGFEVRSAAVTAANHPDTQSAYDEISYQQRNAIQHPSLGSTYNIGSDAAAIAQANSADGVIFVTFQGLTRSHSSVAAEATKDTLITLGTAGLISPTREPNGSAVLLVAFVDGRTGDVLWQNQDVEIWGVSVPAFDNDDLARMVTKVLDKFPS